MLITCPFPSFWRHIHKMSSSSLYHSIEYSAYYINHALDTTSFLLLLVCYHNHALNTTSLSILLYWSWPQHNTIIIIVVLWAIFWTFYITIVNSHDMTLSFALWACVDLFVPHSRRTHACSNHLITVWRGYVCAVWCPPFSQKAC